MRIAVCDLSVGDLDILDLDKEAEDLSPLGMIKTIFHGW